MTRALTTAGQASVAAERNRHAWNLPRQPAASPARLGPATLPRDDAGLPPVLDWRAFVALHFPGRRRHDFEAVMAYGAYKGTSRRRPDPIGPRRTT